MVGRIAEAGADYRKATEALPPELRDMLPKIAIRNMVAPEKIVEGWLPSNPLEVPEIAVFVKKMSAEKGEYHGKDPQAVLDALSAKLDRMAAAEISQNGALGSRLFETREAR